MKTMAGTHILFCRPREDSRDYQALFSSAGVETVFLPMFDICMDTESREAQEILRPGGFVRFDWVLFSSPRGVNAFCAALQDHAVSTSALRHTRCGVVGQKAAGRLAETLPDMAVAASADTLQQLLGAIKKIDKRPLIRLLHPTSAQSLAKISLSVPERMQLSRIVFYRTVPAKANPTANAARTSFDVIVFSSPTSFDYFLERYSDAIPYHGALIATFGKTTAAYIRGRGYRVDIVPENPAPAKLLAAIETALGANQERRPDTQQSTRKPSGEA